jgi:hypothetical protein
MPSTIQLQDMVNYAQQCIRMAPLTGVGGIANQPAFTIGNWVRNFILGAPFAWRWNRGNVGFFTSTGQQDYVQPLSMGWLENGSASGGSPQKSRELQVILSQSIQSSDTLDNATPTTVTPYSEDSSGNVTFRLTPVPDGFYAVTLNYQTASPTFFHLTDTWAPIPDYLNYIVQTGFLAKTYEYINHENFAQMMSLFVKQVMAANAGLADSQNNIYMTEFINSQREMQAQLGNSQAGRAGRGLFG